MPKTETPKPFILRSEVVRSDSADHKRRETLLSELTDEELDRVAGGTNYPSFIPTWDPDSGADFITRQDWPEGNPGIPGG